MFSDRLESDVQLSSPQLTAAFVCLYAQELLHVRYLELRNGGAEFNGFVRPIGNVKNSNSPLRSQFKLTVCFSAFSFFVTLRGHTLRLSVFFVTSIKGDPSFFFFFFSRKLRARDKTLCRHRLSRTYGSAVYARRSFSVSTARLPLTSACWREVRNKQSQYGKKKGRKPQWRLKVEYDNRGATVPANRFGRPSLWQHSEEAKLSARQGWKRRVKKEQDRENREQTRVKINGKLGRRDAPSCRVARGHDSSSSPWPRTVRFSARARGADANAALVTRPACGVCF